jgi:SAM-dependent methyltransferase
MRFDQKAQTYEAHAGVQQRVALWCAEWLERDLRHETAIEFGAGPGTFTRHVLARGCSKFIANDLSRAMINLGKETLPNVEWQQGDAWAPAPRRVTRVYSTSLLQWAECPEDVLRRWQELLVPDGRLLVSLFIEGSLHEFSKSDPHLVALCWRSEHWWLSAVERSGLHVERASTWETKTYFPSSIQALRAVHTTGACASQHASAVSLRRALRRYDEEFRDVQGVPASWRALRIEAAKHA